MSVLSTVALVASLASSVAAHGYVQGLVVGGTYYEGYSPSMQYASPPPSVIGWSDPSDLGNGFVSDYTSPDIICHLNATNAPISATVAAGDKVEFQWTSWPSSHHGPVITYLANCNGDCSTVDKTTLKFVKIDQGGLDSDATVPGTWATDSLIANNNSWTSTIPSDIIAGNYVIRHEIIALHSAGTAGGAQNYPQCMNLKVTGTGTESPTGTLGEALYQESDAGILINIYQSLSTYDIPGPTLFSGASAAAQTSAASSVAASSSVAVTSSAAASTSSAASSTSVASTKAAVASTTTPSTTAAATSAAAVSSAAASIATTVATAVVTDQVYTTVTGSASAAASSAVAPLASLASALPSADLTSTIGTVLPSATGSASNGTAVPSKALPAGTTLADLLEWIQYLFAKDFSASKVVARGRAHARDVLAAR